MTSAPINDLEMVLRYYAAGYFPMAVYDNEEETYWHRHEDRAVLPIHTLHVSRKLRRYVLEHPYTIRVDTAFDAVVGRCAENREQHWLNKTIQDLFSSLHQAGYAHSVECWTRDGQLAGGVYGLAMGGAFCAESMFSRESNASKVALVHLCARLAAGGFTLLDAQILNDHTAQFGAYEITLQDYLTRLRHARQMPADFHLRAYGPVTPELLVNNFLSSGNIKKYLTIS